MDKIKINLTEECKPVIRGLYIIKLKEAEYLKRFNSDRLSNAVGGSWVVLDSFNSYRIRSRFNPHLADKIAAAGVEGYYIDGLGSCIDVSKRGGYLTDGKREAVNNGIFNRECEIDFLNVDIKPIFKAGEKVCKHCGRAINNENKRLGDYCEACIMDEDGLGYFYGYHNYCGGYKVLDKNAEKIDYSKTLTFGCEIERDYAGVASIEDRRNALKEACKILYNKPTQKTQRKAVFMHDGSLCCGGVEWITQPATEAYYKKHVNEFNKMLDNFKSYDFINTSSVGNHIHINRSYFGERSKEAACKMALMLAIFWDEFKALAKREITSYTSKPTHKKTDDIFTLVEKTLNARGEHSVAINQQHNNTIEVRLWGGIDTAEDLLLFINLTKALAKCAKFKSIESVQKMSFKDYLKKVDKKYLTEIKKRLNDKGINRHNADIKNLIEEGV